MEASCSAKAIPAANIFFKLSLCCSILPYYGYLEHYKHLMIRLCMRSKDTWKDNAAALTIAAQRQEITVIDCEDMPFSQEFYDLALQKDAENRTSQGRFIDSYYLTLMINTKQECIMFTKFIKEIVRSNSIVLFESINILEIQDYKEEYNHLYCCLKKINVSDEKIKTTIQEYKKDGSFKFEYLSTCDSKSLVTQTKTVGSLTVSKSMHEINKHLIKNYPGEGDDQEDQALRSHGIICRSLEIDEASFPETTDIKWEKIIPTMKFKPSDSDSCNVSDSEDSEVECVRNETIKRLIFNFLRSASVAKYTEQLKPILPNLNNIRILGYEFDFDEFWEYLTWVQDQTLDSDSLSKDTIQYDYETEDILAAIYSSIKHTVMIVKNKEETKVVSFESMEYKCQILTPDEDIKDASHPSFLMVKGLMKVTIKDLKIINAKDSVLYSNSMFFQDTEEYMSKHPGTYVILPNNLEKLGYIVPRLVPFLRVPEEAKYNPFEKIRVKKLGFCFSDLTEDLLNALIRIYKRLTKNVEIYLIFFALPNFKNVVKLTQFLNSKNLVFFGFSPVMLERSEDNMALLDKLLVELHSPYLQFAMKLDKQKLVKFLNDSQEKRTIITELILEEKTSSDIPLRLFDLTKLKILVN